MTAACPACGDRSSGLFEKDFYSFEDKHYDLVRCMGCGLIRVAPMPDRGTISRMYNAAYFKNDWSLGFVGDYLSDFKKRRDEFEKILTVFGPPQAGARLLEFGSAGGAFVDLANSKGWRAEGVEISEWGVRTAKEKYGLTLQHCNLLDAKVENGSYDAVFLGDVFEHVDDPVEVLKFIHDKLKPGGKVGFLLPMYISSSAYLWVRALGKIVKLAVLPSSVLRILKLEKATISPPYHLFEYSPRTIQTILMNNGFKFLKLCGLLPYPDSLLFGAREESFVAKSTRVLAKWVYGVVKFGSENFNVPILRALVLAEKKNPHV